MQLNLTALSGLWTKFQGQKNTQSTVNSKMEQNTQCISSQSSRMFESAEEVINLTLERARLAKPETKEECDQCGIFANLESINDFNRRQKRDVCSRCQYTIQQSNIILKEDGGQ